MAKSIASSWRLWAATCLLAPCALSAEAASSLCGAPNSAGASLCSVDPSLDSAALCNDGTQPVFWIRPGSGTGLHRWVIWLEGGGECTDIASCQSRAQSSPQFLTSTGFAANPGAGVTSSDPSVNPLLYNANAVLVHYCSSDDWSGGYGSGRSFDAAKPNSWNFQGRRIALAAVATLEELGLGFGQAKQILLGGSSAGGIGATVVANDLVPVLPSAADVRFANDAGFAIEIGQFDASAPPPYVFAGQRNAFEQFFASAIKLWHGRGDAKCDAAAQTGLQHALCYATASVMSDGFIALPSFVAESRLDSAQLQLELCADVTGSCPLPESDATPEGIYADAFASRMAKDLNGAGTEASFAVYSPDEYMHVILGDSTAFTTAYPFPGGKLTAQAVFDAWLKDPSGSRIVDIGTRPGIAGATKHAN